MGEFAHWNNYNHDDDNKDIAKNRPVYLSPRDFTEVELDPVEAGSDS